MKITPHPSRARRGRIPLLGLVVLLVVALIAMPVASTEDEGLMEKVERRTGLSDETKIDDLERRLDSPANDHVDTIEHKLHSMGPDDSDENETQNETGPPVDPNGTVGNNEGEGDPSGEGPGGNGSRSGQKDAAKQKLGPIGGDCPASSADSCEPSRRNGPSGTDPDDDPVTGQNWGASGGKSKAPSPSANEAGDGPADNKDDHLTKTATGSGIVMVLAWTLFVASTGPLGRSGKDDDRRQRPQLHLTPGSQRAQESESRAKPQSRQAPSRRR